MSQWPISMKRAGTGTKTVLLAFFIFFSVFFIAWYFYTDNSYPQISPASQAPISESSLLALSGQTMGTQYRILLHDSALSSESAKAVLAKSISDRLYYLDKSLFSAYAPDSEITQLNQAELEKRFSVSEEIVTVLVKAQEVYTKSSGAFDMTIKPLVDLWGFGTTGLMHTVPEQEAIDQAKAQMGMAGLELNRDTDKAYVIKHRDVFLDLSAIAKGYAVDQIGLLLDSQGQDNYLVEIGGEVITLGRRPDGAQWRIGIERPQPGQKILFQRIQSEPGKIAIATSGSYLNFFTDDDQRYSHTINPLTGKPVSHNLVSVTVVDESAMTADAWATALLVYGLEEGMKLANDLQLAAFFIVNSSTGFKALHSDAFNPYL